MTAPTPTGPTRRGFLTLAAAAGVTAVAAGCGSEQPGSGGADGAVGASGTCGCAIPGIGWVFWVQLPPSHQRTWLASRGS